MKVGQVAVPMSTFLVKGIALCTGVVIGVPFMLGIASGDLDATMATYKLIVYILWDLDLWMIPLAYIGYKLIRR